MIKYKKSPFRYYNDKSLGVTACPFPIKTDTFEIVDFGKNLFEENATYAHIIYTKRCGHTVLDRISFYEGIEDFEHFGTKFKGADYSIKNWKDRIEYFRVGSIAMVCDCCKITQHAHWTYRQKLTEFKSRAKLKEYCKLILDSNYENWQEFVDIEKDLSTKIWRNQPDLDMSIHEKEKYKRIFKS